MSHRSIVPSLVLLVLSFTFTAGLRAQGTEGRIFFPTDDTIAIWEFNGFSELPDGTPLPNGTVVPDLSGNGLDATVESNGSDLVLGAGDFNFETSPGANRELRRVGTTNGAARLGVNDDQDLFEMPPEQDFSLELYVNRESTGEAVRWGILAGNWHSRATADDALDANTQGAWYGYGLIRADENQPNGTPAPWSFVLNPLTGGVDGTPNIGCCNENHAFFDFPTGYHYLVLVVNRVDQAAITYLDGFEINRRTLNPDWSFTTPNGYEHARFTMFSGEDDPSRNVYRQSPAGVHLDAARVQRRAMAPAEVEETWNNILSGQPSPLPPNTLNALITASTKSALVGQCVKLDGSPSTPGGTQVITKYEWKVGSGAYEAGDPVREVSFDAPSTDGYPVSLRVTNSTSETDEATVLIKVQKLDPVARIAASIAGQPAPGIDIYIPLGSVLTLDGTLSGYNVPSSALRCPIADGLLIEPPAVTGYAWDLDGRPATIEDTRAAFDPPPYNTVGDFRAVLQVTAADGTKSARTTLNVHVSDAQGNTRVFHNTDETVLHFEFNELPDVFDGTPIPTASVVEDLSGNGLNGTVASNDGGDLIMGPGVGSLDVPLGSNREVKHAIVSNYSARIAVEDDGGAFEMFPDEDFSIELYVNREATNDPVKWGILAGTWKSRNMLDDAAGDPDLTGAWYGYGLIRSDENVVGGSWSWVLSPLQNGPDSLPSNRYENHAFFTIPDGRHYVALSVNRASQTAITFLDGRQAAIQNLQPGWSFTTPVDYEHATFTLFSGEDDPSRNAYRPAPAGTEIDAVRVQRKALTTAEALQNFQNIKLGKGANPEFAPTLPAAPAGLVATPGNGEVALDWSDNSEAGLQGYHVYRSEGTGPASKITAQPVAESRYRDQGLTNGTEYCYRVAAVTASGAGPLSQAACAQPGTVGAPKFRRGDVDATRAIDINDPVLILGYLFLGAATPQCLEAADTDDNGEVDITDAVNNLGYQFLGGPAPDAPGPIDCGVDGSAPFLGCNQPCP